jgi:hypothetical protein
MAYVAFDKLPLNFALTKDATAIAGAADGQVLSVEATNVSISYNANLATTRVLGADATRNNLQIGGPPSLSLSFNGILSDFNSEFDPFDFTGDSANGTVVHLGKTSDQTNGMFIKKLYMNSFTVNVSPYAPVTYSCDFVGYDHFGGLSQSALGDLIANDVETNLPGVDNTTMFHGAYSSLVADGSSSTTALDASFFDSVSYTYSQAFQPVYTMGNIEPSTVEFMSAEQSLSFTCDQIERFIPVSGKPATAKLLLNNATSSNTKTVTVNGRLTQESISVAVGDVGRGSMTIVEPLK